MIEYTPRDLSGADLRKQIYWTRIPRDYTCDECLFRSVLYKIQGKIYRSFTDAFVKAFEQERMWEQLNG